jgi:cytoskeleton protein RodZ
MNNDTGNTVDDAAAEPAGPVCGERLAESRRTLQITVLEIAKELHLDEPKVRALESNDFEVLGAPVFAKGHMRKYAELVGVDIDDVLADYYQLTRSSAMPPVILGRTKIKRESSPGPWIVAIILILAAALAYWLIVARDSGPVEDERSSATQEEDLALTLGTDQESQVTTSVAEESAVAEPLDVPGAEVLTTNIALPATTSIDAELIAEEVAEKTAAGTADDGQLRVALSFSGECWTEISDADGRRLFFDMGRDGRTVDLSGKAPFSALFGNAENVSVKVNGSDYTIPALGRRGNTARITISNPQS